MNSEKPYSISQTERLLKLSRYLLTQADSRGLTHGEKHFLMQTALFLLHKASALLLDEQMGIERHEVDSIGADDIPF